MSPHDLDRGDQARGSHMNDSCTSGSKAALTSVQQGICLNTQIFGGVQRASDLLPSCFRALCPVPLSVLCGMEMGEGRAEQLRAWSQCIVTELAESSAVQGLGTHSKGHTGPQPVSDRAEEDGASPASERARPVVFEASHWSLEP